MKSSTIKKKIVVLLTGSFLVFSCVSIPVSTVALTKEVIKEANDMHQLNITLVHKLFAERRARINLFITTHYTPSIIKNYEKLLPDTLNYKKELSNIIESIIPVITRKKDSLQGLLHKQEQKIIADLNSNYISYQRATVSLQNIINAVAKLETAENEALASIKNLTGGSLDIKKIETKIDGLLQVTGATMGKIIGVENIIKR